MNGSGQCLIIDRKHEEARYQAWLAKRGLLTTWDSKSWAVFCSSFAPLWIMGKQDRDRANQCLQNLLL